MKKIFRNVFFIGFFCMGFLLLNSAFSLAYEKEIKSLSSNIAEKIAKAGKKNIAVVDFTDLQGNVTELGRFISEELSVSLSESDKGFEVVDRNHLKTLIREHKLSATGLIDPGAARKLGQIAGVGALITGTITPFGDSVRLSVKVLDTATARVIASSSGDIAKTKAIEELLSKGIDTGTGTGQSSTPQAEAPAYTPPAGKQYSKKVGDFVVTVKKIMILSDQEINVDLDFTNLSEAQYKLDVFPPEVSLVDEKGNNFSCKTRIKNSILFPKSNNGIILKFIPKNSIKSTTSIGNDFDVALKFRFEGFDYKAHPHSKAEVSFANIRAQKPR